MKRVLEVKEFETIIKASFNKSGDYKVLPDLSFVKLEQFIRSFTSTEENTDVLDFMKIGYKRSLGTTITFKNYVGLIELSDGYQINILPKISFVDENNDQTKRVFVNMLRSLRNFPAKVFTSSNLNVDKMNLYEIFISMYIEEVRDLIKKGLRADYIKREENLNCYKGKLLFKEQIRYNSINKTKFFVSFDSFSLNRSENKIIKSTLLKLEKESLSNINKKEISNLLSSFEFVSESKNYNSDFSKIVINRNNKDYEQLIIWSKVFLFNKSFTTFAGTTIGKSLLFPMETVFEAYIAKVIRKLLDKSYTIKTQDRTFYLFDEPRKFLIKPDIVIKSNSGKVIILDTKWKSLINKPSKNYSISQSDMYQMYAYAKKYNTSDIWLLYPLNEEMKEYKDAFISFKASIEDNVTVKVYFIDILNIEDSIKSLLSNI